MRAALGLARSFFRPSTLIRGFWLMVAGLHLAIFARRLAEGEWLGGMNQARLMLLIAATVYGLVRTWRAAEFFDGPPRKVFTIILLAIVGHGAVSARPAALEMRAALGSADWAEVALVAPLILGAALVLAAACDRRRTNGGASNPQAARAFNFSVSSFNPIFPLFARPPPAR